MARRRAVLLVVPVLAGLAACGTTLPQQTQSKSVGSQALGAPLGSSSAAARGATGSGTSSGAGGGSAGGSSLPDGAGSAGGSAGSGASSGGGSTGGGGPTGTGGTGGKGTHGHSNGGSTTKHSTGSLSPLVKGPIQIGFMAASSAGSALAAIGAHSADQETPQQAFAYFVNQINRHGGLDGRRVEVVQDFIDPISSNYDVQASAACADFTQDHHVAVVMSVESSYYSQQFSACMASAGVPELLAVTGGIDSGTLNSYPTLFSPTAPTVGRRFAALIRGLTGNGYLSKKTKVGVVVEDCPFNNDAYNSVVAPMLKAKGITVYRRDFGCVHGFGDAAVALAQIQNQVLPLRSAGATRVMFVSGFETVAAEYFEKQAHSQGYTPGYALTSTADIGDNAPGFSPNALSRVEGVGWEPDYDVTGLVPGSPATTRCRSLWRGFGPAAARVNRDPNETICDEFFVLEAALNQTRASSNPQALESALLGLGSSYVSPLVLAGATRYGSNDKDAPTMFATFGYKASCGCIAYTGSPQALG